MEDHSSFSLLAKKFKKRSFGARSLNQFWEFFDPYLLYRSCAPPLEKCFCQLGGGAQDQENK
jgi:hypothetical protein